MALHTRIVVGLLVGTLAGLAASAVFGHDDPRLGWLVENVTTPVGELFLRLLIMTVIPLIFSALVIGVAEVGDPRRIGRIGVKAFAYTLVISAISVAIALVLANTMRPGERVAPETAAALRAEYAADASGKLDDALIENPDAPLLEQLFELLVPVNPVESVASETPALLQLMFFALVVGLAATMVKRETVAPFLGFLEGLYAVTTRIVAGVMRFAPYAVAALLFSNVAAFGLDLLIALGWFIATVLLGLALHMFGVYSISVAWLSRIAPLEFFRRVRVVMLTAFSTSSSNATLPTAIEETQKKLGVPKEISSFVLTIGATMNQNGTALYEGVTVLFLAQLAGVELGIGEQLAVAWLAIVGGIGTAGVPGGSIPFIIVVLASLGVNPGLIAIVLGVDRLLDMCRTTLNVTGDITAATFVARSEGHPISGGFEDPAAGSPRKAAASGKERRARKER